MRINRIFSIFIIIVFSSCQKRETKNNSESFNYPIRINVIEGFTNKKDIRLSDVADSISYIFLKNVNEKPIGTILDYHYFKNNIFIHIGGNQGGFYRFDGNGNFINEISSLGRGPGEYTQGSTFSVLINPERFYILCNFVPHNLLEFDYTGKFLNKVFTSNPSDGNFEVVSSERFVFLANTTLRIDTSAHYMACVRNRSNKIISMIDHPFFSNPKHKNLDRFLYGGARSGIYYKGMPLIYDANGMNTIFSIRNDSLYSRYIIDLGNKGAPFEKLYSYSLKPERYNYLSPISFVETENDVFILAIFENKDFYLFKYNKGSQCVSCMKTPYTAPELSKIRQPIAIFPKFENDIDGGISVGPGKPNLDGDIWTYKYDAMYFRSLLTKEYLQKSKASNLDKKKALIELVDSIEEFNNPILMIVYLKKKHDNI